METVKRSVAARHWRGEEGKGRARRMFRAEKPLCMILPWRIHTCHYRGCSNPPNNTTKSEPQFKLWSLGDDVLIQGHRL